MAHNGKMRTRVTGAMVVATLVAASLTGLAAGPVTAADDPPGAATATSATIASPAPPEFDSATPTSDAITVAWTWGPETPAPAEVTSVVVRAEPGGHLIRASRTEFATTLTDLDPDTEYVVTLTSITGDVTGEPTDPVSIRTLPALDTDSDVVDAASSRPLATPGDVSSLIVTLTTTVAPAAQAEQATEELPVAGVVVEDTQDLGAGNVRVDLNEGVSEADAAVMMAEIESDPRVASVSVDRRVSRSAFPSSPPNDPYWTSNSLWGLYGTFGVGIASDRLTMNPVWSGNQGSGTVVAVLDTGSTSHPDLDANYVAGYDFVGNRSGFCRSGASSSDGDYVNTGTYGALGWDSNPLDPGDWTTVTSPWCGNAANSSWHGTHVAGTVAAVGNNGAGVIGVAPQARIQPVRVLSYDGGYTSDIVAAITWASGGTVSGVPANATPANVINLSLGGVGSCTSDWQTAINGAVSRGTVVVVSAGNSTADPSGYSPASCANVITVASSTSSGTLSSFSNYGSSVEITAPGSGIWSTMNGGATTPGSATYTSYSGTSMAAPHVSGVAALLRATDGSRTPAQILSIIQSTALGFPTTGSWYDCTTSICGAGLLRAATTSTPVIYSTSPETGPIAGGGSVTLTGINLGNASAVTFGGTSAAITAQTSTTLTVTAPARAAGEVDIVVTNPNGSGTSLGAYRYFSAPTATSLSVSSGTTAGGTTVVISGTNLAPNDVQDSSWITVSFGGAAATVWLPGTTSVQVTTPPRPAGTVDVVVTTPGGSSTLAGAFTFVAPASSGGGAGGGGGGGGSSSASADSGGGGALQEITEVRPAFGPVSGGNLVAIIGYGFTGATSVTIGGVPASFRVVNDATVEVTMPAASAAGSADVAVNLNAVRGRAFAPGGYVYRTDSPAAPAPSPSTPPVPSPGADSGDTAGDFVTFAPRSSDLGAGAKTRLTRLARTVGDAPATGSVTAYADARGSASSTKVARDRARAIVAFLRSTGVSGTIATTIERGDAAALRTGAIVLLSTDPGANAMTSAQDVSSLIVRYRPGVTPTVNGKVRGSSLVPTTVGAGMTLGPNLGLRMYRIDLAQSLPVAQAEKVASQMMKDPGIEFVEPDRIVSAQVSRG